MSGCASTSILTIANAVISIKRQVYVGDKSTYSEISTGTPALLKPLSEERSSLNGFQFGTAFSLTVDSSVDIGESDRITDGDGRLFDVRGSAEYRNALGFAFKRAILVLPQND